jgi:hypothetical protein
MSATVFRRLILLAAALAGLLSCDRNIEPFVPGEQPSEPDLSKIFPAGAERAGRSDRNIGIPPLPEQGGRGMDPTAEAPPIRGTITVPDELRARIRRAGRRSRWCESRRPSFRCNSRSDPSIA